MRLLPVMLLLSGCASVPGEPIKVLRVALDEQELQRVCARNSEKVMPMIFGAKGAPLRPLPSTGGTSAGCFDKIGDVCVMYTRKGNPLDEKFQKTIGHEFLHCELGLYH